MTASKRFVHLWQLPQADQKQIRRSPSWGSAVFFASKQILLIIAHYFQPPVRFE